MQPFEPTDRSREIGRRLKKLRRLSGMTQVEAIDAAELDISESTLSRLELGYRLARDGELFSLAKAYGVTLQHITKHDSAVDRPDFKIGDPWQGAKSQAQLPLNVPKPGPHLIGGRVNDIIAEKMRVAGPLTSTPKPPAPTPLREAAHAALSGVPVVSPVLTPSQYVEQVYVPSLERRVEELTAQLAEANRLLRANGYSEVKKA